MDNSDTSIGLDNKPLSVKPRVRSNLVHCLFKCEIKFNELLS